MTDEVRDSWPGIIKKFVGFAASEVVDAVNSLINDINAQLSSIYTQIQALGGSQPLGGDLTGTLPNPSIAPGAVTASKIASHAVTSPAIILGQSLLPVFNVTSYGATGNGVTDDTSSLNSAISAANALAPASTLYIPYGQYVVSSTLTTCNCSVKGDGPGASVLLPPTTVGPLVIVAPVATGQQTSIKLEGIGVYYSSAATSGAGNAITFKGNSGTNLAWNPLIRDVFVNNCYNGVSMQDTTYATVDSVHVINASHVAFSQVQSSLPDFGDAKISNCLFYCTGAVGSSAFFWNGGGGLHLIGNKFFNANNLVNIILPNLSTGTSQLNITGNSLDTITLGTIGVVLTRTSTTKGLSLVNICDNVMSNMHYAVWVPTDANGGWINGLTVTGNSIALDTQISPTTPAAFVIDDVGGVLLANNVVASDTSGTSAIVYAISSGTNGGVVGPNVKIGSFGTSANGGTFITIISPT